MKLSIFMSDNFHNRLSFAIAIVLTVLVAKQTSSLLWNIFSTDNNFAPTRVTPIVKNSYDKIDYDIFGLIQKKIQQKPKQKAPITKLDLKLVGILATDPMHSSLAIIVSGDNVEKIYKIGDILPGNVILSEVYLDRVIISRQGERETLYLPKDENVLAIKDKDPATASIKKPKNKKDDNKKLLSEEKVLEMKPRDLRQELLKRPEEITKYAVAVPQYEKGKLIGYKIRMKKYQALLQQQGLIKDDIITSINGVQLNNPKNAFKVLSHLTNAAVLNLTILRNGLSQNVSVSFQ
jgi:general secretion pathway protein C